MFSFMITTAKKDPEKFKTEVLSSNISNKDKILKEISSISKISKAKSTGKSNKQKNYELTAITNDGATHMYHATILTELQQNQLKYKIVSFDRFM